MARLRLRALLGQIHDFLSTRQDCGDSDGALLERFVGRGDETAFEALLQRHGPMVLGLCRRLLADSHEAEDAFQATFLVLIRKARSIRRQASLGSWLFGVAWRIAQRARAARTQRRQHEQTAARTQQATAPATPALDDLRCVLEEELHRLPAKYRAPMVLCYFEGKTNEEAAQQLHWPTGTVQGRLARARRLLRSRLTRRGVTLGSGALAALEAVPQAPAAVPAGLQTATVKAGVLWIASGQTVGLSPEAVRLAQGLLHTMKVTKMRILLIGLILAATLSAATGWWWQQTAAPAVSEPPPDAPQAKQPLPVEQSKAKEKEPAVDFLGDPLPAGALARMGTLRLRQGGRVTAVAVSPDGSTLASGGFDRVVRWWDAATGKELRSSGLHPDYVIDMVFSLDGKRLYSCCGTVYFWEVATGKQIEQTAVLEKGCIALALSPNGKTLAMGTITGLRLWDTAGNISVRLLGDAKEAVSSVAFSPDGRWLACTGDQLRVHVWDLQTQKEVYTFKGMGAAAYNFWGVRFSPDKKLLAATRAGETYVWDLITGKEVGKFGREQNGRGVVFSADSKKLIAPGRDGWPHLWDIASGKELAWFSAEGEPGEWTMALALTKDGKTLVSGHSDHTVRLWDAATGKEILPFGVPHTSVSAVAWADGGKTLVSGSRDGVVHRWDAGTGKELGTLAKLQGTRPSVAVSPDGKVAAAGALGVFKVQRWQVDTGKELPALEKPAEAAALAFSPNGQLLAAGGWDQRVRVWRQAGALLHTLDDFKGPIYTVAFSPDGRLLAASGNEHPKHADWGDQAKPASKVHGIVLWDAATGKLHGRLGNHLSSVRALAFSPDGKILAAAPNDGSLADGTHSDKEKAVRLWEVASGKERLRLEAGFEGATALTFVQGGKLLAVGTPWSRLQLWDAATGKLLQDLRGHRHGITSLALSQDGQRLGSASQDGTILVWDVSQFGK
jgi:RNA polymerase sigma factor (sigma-70 family)